MIAYILLIICVHGVDNKDLTVDTIAHANMQTCKAKETVIKQQFGSVCKQFVTECQERPLLN